MIRPPVFEIENALFAAIDAGKRRFVVSAPTGSGKSTALPVMLSKKLGGKIIVLQPRRVAARMLAKSVGRLFDMEDAVGWHVRFEKHYDESSKIIFLTEGILARMLLSDRGLKGVSAIVFDEFHERNIYADVSLALALRTQKLLRPDLTIAVCSASMDSDALYSYLGTDDCVRLECSSTMHNIEISYSPPSNRDVAIWDNAAAEFAKIATSTDAGNILIFMAGAYEISRTIGKILQYPSSKGFDVLALHGELPSKEQDRVLAPSDKRKVIVTTNIAETSLTIEGVKFVIDSGLAKVARYDTARGLNTLLTERISLASATQRAGRAGRTSAGSVIRLWREADEVSFEKFTASEISRLDLSQIILWLKAGNVDIETVRLFETPPNDSYERAIRKLKNLGAIDSCGSITPLGRDMATFPTEPRLAKMLLEGVKYGCLELASLIAAITDCGRIKLPIDNPFAEAERDAMVGDAFSEPEEIAQLCLLAKENSFSEKFCRDLGIHAANARKACMLAADLARLARQKVRVGGYQNGNVRLCILSAFSDYIGVRLNKGTLACRLAAGRNGEVRKESRSYADDIFVALNLQERQTSQGVSIAASMLTPVSLDEIKSIFPDDVSEISDVQYSETQKRVVAGRIVKFRDVVISEALGAEPSKDLAAEILVEKIFDGTAVLKNFDDAAKAFIERVNLVADVCPESNITPIGEAELREIFLQMCWGSFSLSQVKNLDVHAALRDWLSPEQSAFLKYAAPKSVEIISGRRPVPVRYDSIQKRAIISASFKDLFNFNPKNISICGGKIIPTFEILAPNGRPAQTTQNLEEFWKTSWESVKKEMKARYPKHFKAGMPWA